MTEDDRAHAHERGVFRPAVQLACSNCERALCPIDPGLGVLMDRFTAKGRPVRADGPTPQRSRPHVKIERYPYDRGEVYAITCGGTRCGWMWVVETGALRRAAREAQQAGRSTVMTAKVGRRLPR